MRQLTLILLFAIQASAATYYIDWDTGNDSTGDGSSGNRWKTFKKGVDTMSAGDTLYVGEGTYEESSWPPTWKDNMTIIGEGDAWLTIIDPSVDEGASNYTFGWSNIDNATVRNVRIRRTSTSGGGAMKLIQLCISNTFDHVIFDGANDQHNVLLATDGNFSDLNVFTNCVWTNMVNVNPVGGSPPHGLYITGARSNLFTHCLFAGSTNDLHDFMVHVFADNGNGNVFDSCEFIYGKAENGARVFGAIKGDDTIVRNCTFRNRSATYRMNPVQVGASGGVYVDGVIFANNTIYEPYYGVVIYNSTNTVFVNNVISRHTGGLWGLDVYSGGQAITWKYNYFSNPTNYTGGTYTNVNGSATFTENANNYWGTGGSDTTNESFGDAASGDFSLGADSDFIDWGTDTSSASLGSVTLDKAGNTRGATYDVGAYEYISGGGGDPATAVKRRGKIPGLGRGRGSWR